MRLWERLHMKILDKAGTLSARAHQGLNASPIGLARVVALAIGISLSIATPLDAQASNQAIRYVKDLADYQLTEKQEKCHNAIVYRESRWDPKAKNGSHYGLYQGKSKSLKNANTVKQWWWYWYYVSHRYGVTEYDEPNYCKALHHLRVKGWQ
jgi:hypothetical protein